jgi:glycosyltransferase involved in cell wall biosynthesis
MIYCQRDIPKEKWRYGFRKSAATGCGWIATYNALELLGYQPDAEKLIAFYERQLPLIHGNAGTTILAPAFFFKKHGFEVSYLLRRERFDQVAKNADVSILFYRWHEGWKIGAHFVALHYTDKGFVGYNTYNNSTGPDMYGESLNAFLKRKKYFGAVLIGIQNKKKMARPADDG